MCTKRVASASLALALSLALACTESPSQIVDGENTPPTVTFVSPTPATTFSGGMDVAVEIRGTDPQDGPLPPSGLSWWAVLFHDTHTHPFLNPAQGASGMATIPDVGHLETDIFYRFYARGVDSGGLVDTTFVDISPNLITMSFETEPSGLRVVVDGQPRTTPIDVESVVGMQRALDAPSPQSSGASSWTFESWSQGGPAQQTYVAPASDVTLIATFSEAGVANVPPSVSITAPADGATVTAGAPVTVSADASDSDGTVTGVQFLVGATVLGTDTEAPFSVQWTPSGTGARTLLARATDDDGATTTSASVGVTVQSAGGGDVLAPVTTLTGPAQGTRGLVGSVSITATATDDVGVTRVEFQVDGETVGTDDTAPYEATLPSTSVYASGAHTFRARARDAAGNWSPWSSASVTFGGGVGLPAGFTRSVVASGFGGWLTAAALAPDGRLFVLEKTGAIRVIKDGALLPTPFASLSVDDPGERGLLGIAFDPDFATNGWVYVYYTRNQGVYGVDVNARISRLTAAGDVAVPGSEVPLVELEQLDANNHIGGAMAFGQDGKLYVAVGDNARPSLAQSLSSRFGKILRFNRDGTIPADNPLIGSTSGEFQAIWALGLRNPFTFGFHPSSGRMHINDVGQDTWEEINLGIPGGNFGWPVTEGPTTNPAYVSPILAYAHFNSPTLYEGFSIVGAAFYDPPTNMFGDAYASDYFFADFVAGWIYRMDSDEWDTAYAFAQVTSSQDLVNLLVADDGSLYVLLTNRVERISR